MLCFYKMKICLSLLYHTHFPVLRFRLYVLHGSCICTSLPRRSLVKERANDLYGATPFIVSNFLIGLPYLCKYTQPDDITSTGLTRNSLDFTTFLNRRLLALKLRAQCRHLLHLGHAVISRPRRYTDIRALT